MEFLEYNEEGIEYYTRQRKRDFRTAIDGTKKTSELLATLTTATKGEPCILLWPIQRLSNILAVRLQHCLDLEKEHNGFFWNDFKLGPRFAIQPPYTDTREGREAMFFAAKGRMNKVYAEMNMLKWLKYVMTKQLETLQGVEDSCRTHYYPKGFMEKVLAHHAV